MVTLNLQKVIVALLFVFTFQAHKAAMDLMKNRQLDSEIRIKAYLAVIECPCAHSANEIKTLLETEPVHQGTVLGPTVFILHENKQKHFFLVNLLVG